MVSAQEVTLGKIPAFPEAGKMIVTENIHPPFPGNLGKPGSRKAYQFPGKAGTALNRKLGRIHKNFQGKLGLLKKLGKVTIYSRKSLEKSTQFPGSVRISLKL